MSNFTTSIPSSSTSPSVDLGVALEGTTTPYLSHRFGSGHIAPFAPSVGEFSLPSSGLDTRVHSLRGDSGCMNVGDTSYNLSYVP